MLEKLSLSTRELASACPPCDLDAVILSFPFIYFFFLINEFSRSLMLSCINEIDAAIHFWSLRRRYQNLTLTITRCCPWVTTCFVVFIYWVQHLVVFISFFLFFFLLFLQPTLFIQETVSMCISINLNKLFCSLTVLCANWGEYPYFLSCGIGFAWRLNKFGKWDALYQHLRTLVDTGGGQQT